MKLFEISTESSKHRFISVVNGLVVELHNISMSLEKMTDDGHGDILKRHAASRTARWFSNNFPIIHSAADALKSIDPAFKHLSQIGVSTFTSSSGKTNLTKHSGYELFLNYVYIALSKIGSSALASRLQQSVAKIDEIIDAGRKEYAESRPTANKEPKVKDDLKGKQSAAVEQMVNDVIKGLPASLQHAARQAVSKSDNKLQALQAFMKQNGNGA